MNYDKTLFRLMNLPALTPAERRSIARKSVKPKGYAWHPGTGPKGETCKTCKHYVRNEYHNKVHLKCGLMRAVWTHGPGSDILAGSPSCKKWECT
jgi:hypothetical protein